MKSSLMFRDQVNILINWFDSWNDCEQTVALYSLFRKLASGQTKFLLQVLHQNGENCFDIQVIESQANNPAYIKNLCQESKDFAVKQLLSFLPLLRSGNTEAKTEYLKIVPQVLSHSIENVCHLEESRQLLSYCLIHPAISSNERLLFHKYTVRLSHLEEQQMDKLNNADNAKENKPYNNVQQHVLGSTNEFISTAAQDYNNAWQNTSSTRDSGIGLEQFSSYVSGVTHVPVGGRAITSSSACSQNNAINANRALNIGQAIHTPIQTTVSGPITLSQSSDNSNVHRKLTRTSVTPPSSTVSDWLNKHHEEMIKHSQDNPLQTIEPHAPLSPQSSVTSSGSDSQQEDAYTKNTFLEESSGMRDVPIWLKSLRLHKYSYLFQQMSYEDMLGLTEKWLESQNVTKGARHKIVLSIQKLKERQHQLRTLEKDIMESGNLKQALQEIKTMLNTPLKASVFPEDQSGQQLAISTDDTIADGDIPGQITRVMGKLCTQLLVTTRPEEGCCAMYLQLLDKCRMHEAWSIEQKKKLATWKQQIQKVWQPTDHRPKKGFPTNAFAIRNLLQGQRALRGQLPKPVGQPASWAFTSQPPTIIPSNLAPTGANLSLYRNNSINTNFNSRPPLYELQLKQQIGRTHSVPMTKSSQNLPVPDIGMEPELAARLDSLCLSMTEHALGNLDSPEKGSTL